MYYRRYGSFRIRDYFGNCIAVLLYLVLAVVTITDDWAWFFSIFFSILVALTVYDTIAPYREHFLIDNNHITVRTGKKQRNIALPSGFIVVLSQADVPAPSSMISHPIGKTYWLKDKYAISLLQNAPLEFVLEKLHKHRVKTYTNSTVESEFNHSNCLFIYSFVCDTVLLKNVLQKNPALVILPQSLSSRLHLVSEETAVYIDEGY